MASTKKLQNLLIDPDTGHPRWNVASERTGPKEDFAQEAAFRLLNRRITLEEIKDQIIRAANDELARRGEIANLTSLNQVKQRIGKSGKDWYFELQRVHQNENLLQQLVDQEGRGLTALARLAGPIQAQRRKGFADKSGAAEIRELIDVLEQLKSKVRSETIETQSILSMCKHDMAKYRALLSMSKK